MMQFRSVEEFLALTGDDAPTTAERALIEACRAGKPCILSQTRPTTASDANTIRAPLLRLLILGGTPDCGLHARGVWLEGAWITGKLNLSFCSARGKTALDKCLFCIRPDFALCKFDLVSLIQSKFPGLIAQGLTVIGSFYFRGAEATEPIVLNGSKVGGSLDGSNSKLIGKDRQALNLQGAEIGQDLVLGGIEATGTVAVNNAKIGGQLVLEGARLDGFGSLALNGQGLDTLGGVFLRRIRSRGLVAVNDARIGSNLECDESTLDYGAGNPTFVGTPLAMNAERLAVSGSVFLRGLSTNGMLNFSSAKIGRQLDCGGGVFRVVGGTAFQAQHMVVSQGFIFRSISQIAGRIDLASARVGDLVDDLESWPKGADDLILDGFTYDRLAGNAHVTLAARSIWLAVGSSIMGDFRPQPHTQFARTLRAMGHSGEARKVLFERDCRLFAEADKADRIAFDDARNGDQTKRADMGLIWCRLHLRRFWSWLSRTTIGHGHKPERAVGCIALLTGVVTLLSWLTWQTGSFAPNSDVILTSPEWAGISAKGCVVAATPDCVENPAAEWSAKNAPGMDWDSFNALAYAADLVVPLVDLGQTQAWAPSKDRGWMGWFMWWGRWMFIIAGWVVASLGLAAVTGFVQKNAPE